MNGLAPSPLIEALPIVRSEDWNDLKFNQRKAFACALFAQASYRHLADFELSPNSRINIVPCYDFQTVVSNSIPSVTASATPGGLEIEAPIVIIRPHVVVVLYMLPKVYFISIRGTRDLYIDLPTDFDSILIRPFASNQMVAFHRGFYRAIASVGDELLPYFVTAINKNIPICITGHSLGGALAAILYSFWLMMSSAIYPYPFIYHRFPLAMSAYSFGMPRYGNPSANAVLPSINHIYSQNDVIPRLPPKRLGYDDPLNEHTFVGGSLRRVSRQRGFFIKNWRLVRLLKRAPKEHYIETYCNKLRVT